MPNKILQANINHASQAQDLLMQVMAERGTGIAVISEPYRIPADNPCWLGDRTGTVAIAWQATDNLLPCAPIESVDGFVAAQACGLWRKWGDIHVVGTYLPPSLTFPQFEQRLDLIEMCLSRLNNRPTILVEDFNSKSTLWGSWTTDQRGRGMGSISRSLLPQSR